MCKEKAVFVVLKYEIEKVEELNKFGTTLMKNQHGLNNLYIQNTLLDSSDLQTFKIFDTLVS